uniref:NADH-ubiquinone oxidoreductase chain 4 n=1 Tax=Ammopiptanthus mongolicus TaxID=126911 RepID=A0A385G280_AMMMO|nr:NADH dehydrogenase subunit 4 [Ammopiptanthus mongolicus]AXV54303.1 NADH dehydrogenase subunit 4 [Ammopiptanthus mongolicus]
MDSSSSQCGGCGHTCANSGNGYKGEIERKLYPTRDGRKLAALHLSSQRALFWIWKTGVAFGSKGMVFRTADLQISLTTEFSERRQIFLWIASFAAFAVKVPMVPVHIWLPEAHVEAPTAGSVILAGIPSKLGTHGFLRFSIPMFPEATLCSTPFIYTPSAIAIIYTSLTTSRQIDLKKIIAYSSVAHMNLSAQLGQLSSLIHRVQCTGLISWMEGTKCSCVVVVRRLDAFPSLPGIVPHRKKERRAPARPLVCTNDNSKRHTSVAYLPFRWHQRDPAKVRNFVSRLLHSAAVS